MALRSTTIISLARRFGIRAFDFARDPRGMVAVEFALIIPVMITLYFGTVETTNAMTAARRVTIVAQTAADLQRRSQRSALPI